LRGGAADRLRPDQRRVRGVPRGAARGVGTPGVRTSSSRRDTDRTGRGAGVTPAVADLGSLLGQDFVHTALLAGVPVAVLSGLVGYFMVLRGQVFAADA